MLLSRGSLTPVPPLSVSLSCSEPGARRAWEENSPSFPRMMDQAHGGDSSEISIGSPILGGGGGGGVVVFVKGPTDLSGRK